MGTVLSDYEGGHGRGVTWATFLVASTLLLMAFSVIPLPSRDVVKNSMEVLMLERMVYHTDIADMEEELSEISEEELTPDDMDEESDAPDIAALMALFEDMSAAPTNTVTAEMFERRGTSTDLTNELNISGTEALGTFGRQNLDLTSGLITRDNAQSMSTRSLNPSLIAPTESRLEFDRARENNLDVIGTKRAIEGVDLVGNDRGIPMLKPKEFEMVIPTPDLAEWLSIRPSEIDPGIRVHFRYKPGSITSKERFVAGGQSYEIQLMYTPGSRSVHVALLEGNTIYYFVDPGTTGRANYFQKGTMRRDEDGFVQLVESEDFSPRGPEATAFFQIFRSWWEAEQNSQQ